MTFNVCAIPCNVCYTDSGLHTAQYESTLIKLSNAEVQIEDLKLQLDDALGAEEMLVQLTERNLMLGEVCATSLGPIFLVSPRCTPVIENRRNADYNRGSRGFEGAQ